MASTHLDARETLPVFAERQHLLDTVRHSQFVVVTGATGSGKSTQIPQYVLSLLEEEADNKLYREGMVAVTQPRRVGAVSLASRVAEEMDTTVGSGKVGFTIRFEDKCSSNTRIRFITDGCLLRECLADHKLSQYAVVILDEAHERSLQTDILLGLMRTIASNRPALRVIVTSATLDSKKFSAFFGNCPVVDVPGRCFPVEIIHDVEERSAGGKYYADAAVEAALRIHTERPLGDILVFLTGRDEIERCCRSLGERIDSLHEDGIEMPDVVILPVYAALPASMQYRIFKRAPPNCRKILFATNIAETSLTVDGIVYVVDSGFVKQRVFNPKSGVDSLDVNGISVVAATQRAGRAGRTRAGVCYRLYTESQFRDFPHESVPEIQRTPLSYTVLLLKQMGVRDPLSFRFLDAPDPTALERALLHLHRLQAVDDDGALTELGRKMCRFPLEPALAKLLIRAFEWRCLPDMLTIAAMSSVERIWLMPSGEQERIEADAIRHRFLSAYGDHVTMLFVYDEWRKQKRSPRWCRQHYFDPRSLSMADNIRSQLQGIVESLKPTSVSSEADLSDQFGNSVHRCRRIIAEVMFDRVAHRVGERGYKTWSGSLSQSLVSIHPSSSLLTVQPKWVVYTDLVVTSKPFMRTLSAISYEWVEALLPQLNSGDLRRLTGRSEALPSAEAASDPHPQVGGKAAEAAALLHAGEGGPYKRRNESEAIESAKERYLKRKQRKKR